jgi:hypothetical protein
VTHAELTRNQIPGISGRFLDEYFNLIPSEPNHSRPGNWTYKLQLGRLAHKLPPPSLIVSDGSPSSSLAAIAS